MATVPKLLNEETVFVETAPLSKFPGKADKDDIVRGFKFAKITVKHCKLKKGYTYI